jgi:hypothetical protein
VDTAQTIVRDIQRDDLRLEANSAGTATLDMTSLASATLRRFSPCDRRLTQPGFKHKR